MTNNNNLAGVTPDYATLFQLGDVLDAVDAGLQAFDAHAYREALVRARAFILAYWGHPALSRECHRSGALGDLYDFTLQEKRLAPKLAMLAGSSSSTYWPPSSSKAS